MSGLSPARSARASDWMSSSSSSSVRSDPLGPGLGSLAGEKRLGVRADLVLELLLGEERPLALPTACASRGPEQRPGIAPQVVLGVEGLQVLGGEHQLVLVQLETTPGLRGVRRPSAATSRGVSRRTGRRQQVGLDAGVRGLVAGLARPHRRGERGVDRVLEVPELVALRLRLAGVGPRRRLGLDQLQAVGDLGAAGGDLLGAAQGLEGLVPEAVSLLLVRDPEQHRQRLGLTPGQDQDVGEAQPLGRAGVADGELLPHGVDGLLVLAPGPRGRPPNAAALRA